MIGGTPSCRCASSTTCSTSRAPPREARPRHPADDARPGRANGRGRAPTGGHTKGVTVGAALDPATASTSGDPERPPRVVWNLVSDAVKFTPAGGRVEIRTERDRDERPPRRAGHGGDEASARHCRISSSGSGRATARTRTHGGLGLGLAVVRYLVELHARGERGRRAGSDIHRHAARGPSRGGRPVAPALSATKFRGLKLHSRAHAPLVTASEPTGWRSGGPPEVLA